MNEQGLARPDVKAALDAVVDAAVASLKATFAQADALEALLPSGELVINRAESGYLAITRVVAERLGDAIPGLTMRDGDVLEVSETALSKLSFLTMQLGFLLDMMEARGRLRIDLDDSDPLRSAIINNRDESIGEKVRQAHSIQEATGLAVRVVAGDGRADGAKAQKGGKKR